MVADLTFLENLVEQKSAFLLQRVSLLPSGRGSSLGRLMEQCVADARADLRTLRDEARAHDDEDDEDALYNQTREVERVLVDLNDYYELFATYAVDVARDDLPVGLLNLIDALVHDLLPGVADPIVHLDSEENYSITNLANSFAERSPIDTPHPIAIHIPALDPQNALLTPFLAHEIAHNLHSDLEDAAAARRTSEVWNAVTAHVDAAARGRRQPDTDYYAMLDDWAEELFCDAVACAVTGPSYVLAMSHFLAVPNVRPGNTHPPDRYRLAFCLDVLSELGWDGFLERQIPSVVTWMRALAGDLRLRGVNDRALVPALDLLRDGIRAHALSVSSSFSEDDVRGVLDEALQMFDKGIPPIGLHGGSLTTWGFVLVGWLSGLNGDEATSGVDGSAAKDEPSAISSVAGSAKLSHLIIKSLEFGRILDLWGSP